MQLAAAPEGAKCLLYFSLRKKNADTAADVFKRQYKVGLLIGVFNCSSTFLHPSKQLLEASHVLALS